MEDAFEYIIKTTLPHSENKPHLLGTHGELLASLLVENKRNNVEANFRSLTRVARGVVTLWCRTNLEGVHVRFIV